MEEKVIIGDVMDVADSLNVLIYREYFCATLPCKTRIDMDENGARGILIRAMQRGSLTITNEMR